MSQQEFVPEPQSFGQENDNAEIYQPQYPYSWSGKLAKEAAPRDEPPFVEPPFQTPAEQSSGTHSAGTDQTMQYSYGYQAQDYAASAKQQGNPPHAADQQWQSPGYQDSGARQKQFHADGDAYEPGYRPYGRPQFIPAQGQGVPWWARPQRHKRSPWRWVFLIILALMFIHPIVTLLGLLLAGIGLLIGGTVLFVVLLPFLLIALSIFMAIFRPVFWPGRRRGWYGRWNHRRGPLWF